MEIKGTEELEEHFGPCPIPPSKGAFVLEIIKGGLCIGKVRLTLGLTILGRNSKMSHEVLDHQSVSRRHAAILYTSVDPPLLKAVDLGSVHGTTLNGAPLKANEPVELIPGSELRFGSRLVVSMRACRRELCLTFFCRYFMMWWFLNSSRSYRLKSLDTMAPPDSVESGRAQRVEEIRAVMEGLSQPPQSSLLPAHSLPPGKTEVLLLLLYMLQTRGEPWCYNIHSLYLLKCHYIKLIFLNTWP